MIKPAFTEGNPIMAGAFAAFVEYAWDQPVFHQQFTEHTGMKRPSTATTVLDGLIDEATGAVRVYMDAFVKWLIAEHWGAAE